MSSESLAAFRRNKSEDLKRLAEEHLRHDLHQSDRDTLERAAKKIGTHAVVGSLIGLGLGAYMAFRVRSTRLAYFKAFRAMEKPTEVRFADGRTEKLPDITPYIKPSRLGDIAAYTFFTAGGLFIGGEMGLLTGSAFASRTMSQDPESMKRIETAMRNYRIDVMKKEIKDLEGSGNSPFPGL